MSTGERNGPELLGVPEDALILQEGQSYLITSSHSLDGEWVRERECGYYTYRDGRLVRDEDGYQLWPRIDHKETR